MTATTSNLTPGDRLVLFATVFITGASVMMLELLGTRFIGPFYGVSLFVWSSLISVALIALSGGYYLGGLIADRYPSFRLGHIIALAAVSSSVIPLISGPVLVGTNPLGLRAGAFFSALILFTVPLTFLGMVSPYVVKLATRSVEGVGLASGSVYAVSTVGSVVGTLLLGFFLLPAIGSRAILYAVSIALMLLAIAVSLFEKKRLAGSPSTLALIAAVIIGAAALWVEGRGAPVYAYNYNVKYEKESSYGWVRVVDDHSRYLRLMLSDSSTISALRMDPGHRGETILPYLYTLEWLPHFHPQGRDALLIGLGGGYIVGALEKRGVVTDAIELDPLVAEAALKWFKLEPPGKLIVGDARYEIKRLDKQYDFIIHDCFTGGSVPPHLLSIEMLRELRTLLRPDGILALNFVGSTDLERDQASVAVSRTLRAVFPHQRVFSLDTGFEFDDFVFFASAAPIEVDREQLPADLAMKVELETLLAGELHFAPERGFIITDDYNPLESMQVRKAEAYRGRFVGDMGTALLRR